uniref:Uncharacterized protein n=1 Tax=Geladintestivirus 1 TaxID=3233133 RepID=A0AAU8MJE5_9CAUD
MALLIINKLPIYLVNIYLHYIIAIPYNNKYICITK